MSAATTWRTEGAGERVGSVGGVEPIRTILMCDAAQSGGGGAQLGMNGGEQGLESADKRGGGRVEVLVIDAVNTTRADGAQFVPFALFGDAFKSDAVSGAAPCGDDDVGVESGDVGGGGLRTGSADELAASGVN